MLIGLAVGSDNGISRGSKFSAILVSGEVLGIVECVEVSEFSCNCIVSDRRNSEFWEGLENRMTADPSPPRGVIFTRYIAEEVLESVKQLLKAWEDS